MRRQVEESCESFHIETGDPTGTYSVFESSQDHVRAGDLGLMFFLVQCPIQRLMNFSNRLCMLRIAMQLNIPPAAGILHTNGAKHDEERSAGDPLLSMCQLRDVFDQAAVSDDAKRPGLFIPARRGESPGFEHFLDNGIRDRLILEPADAHAVFE